MTKAHSPEPNEAAADQPAHGADSAPAQSARADAAAQPAAAKTAAGDAPPADAPPADAPPADVASLRAELQEANDRVLRVQAELENFRKRTRRELEEERRYATSTLMRDLLSVVDNLQRAIQSAEQSESSAGLLEGVKMVATQLSTVLQQNECKPIAAVGAPFDPHLHEAVGHEPSTEHAPNTVTRELQTGYRLHDRVIRPAQVFIAAPPPAPDQTTN